MTELCPLAPRLLITAATLAYGLGPFVTDMNRTHLVHPAWPGHARFHLVWAAVSQLAVSFIALWLLWHSSTDPVARGRLAAIIGLCLNSGFFAALVFKRFYRGTLHDPQGIPPIAGKIDGNLLAVGAIVGLLLIGLGLLR